MSETIPKLITGYRPNRLVFEDIHAFPYAEWAPKLVEITKSRNIEQQRLAIASACIYVGASYQYQGLNKISEAKAKTYSYGLEARYRVNNENEFSLNFLRINAVNWQASVGYQTPDETTPNPAYAIIEQNGPVVGSYKRLVKYPEEKLSNVEFHIGNTVVESLAMTLNERYPGLEIFDRIKELM